MIKPRKPWRTLDLVEYATAKLVHWFDHGRIYEYCGDIPPVDRYQPPARFYIRKSPNLLGRFNETVSNRQKN